MSTRSARLSTALTMGKDVVFWCLGVWLIVHEVMYVPPTELRVEVLILGAVLSGVPGAGVVWAARHGAGTSGALSPPQQSPQLPSSATSEPPPRAP